MLALGHLVGDVLGVLHREGQGGGIAAPGTDRIGHHSAALAERPPASADLVLVDPPYPLGEAEVTGILALLVPVLRDAEAVVVLERSSRSPEPTLPEGLEIFRDRTMGETRLWFLQLTAD